MKKLGLRLHEILSLILQILQKISQNLSSVTSSCLNGHKPIYLQGNSCDALLFDFTYMHSDTLTFLKGCRCLSLKKGHYASHVLLPR